MNPSNLSGLQWAIVIGAIFATSASVVVLVEYLVLVPIKRSPGAKRLAGLLLAVALLLLNTVIRFFFREIPYRDESQVVFFWSLGFAVCYLGWHIWKDQLEGARRYRALHQKSKPKG